MLCRWTLRRRLQRRFQRLRANQWPILWILGLLFLLDVWHILGRRPVTVRTQPSDTATTAEKPSVFIVSVHRNTEQILRRGWMDAMVALASYLGPDNVFVSAVESGSQEGTKDALVEMQLRLDELGIGHRVVLGPTVWGQLEELHTWPADDSRPEERPNWIWDPLEKHYALRRIPYLAKVRNQAMEPLQELLSLPDGGRRFDYVLWINDVLFDVADALTLLETHGGDFAAACAVDFATYPLYYDTFVMRDEHGNKAVSRYWPWFRSVPLRRAVEAGDAVRVQSCWNGMIAFASAPFYGANMSHPLAFRGVDDSLAEYHLEGSECCLVHADNPLTATSGVWLNPNVRVAYSPSVYRNVRCDLFPGGIAAVIGAWANRLARAKSLVQFTLENRAVLTRLRQWRAATPEGEEPRSEAGAICLINEMQIMWENGWRHI